MVLFKDNEYIITEDDLWASIKYYLEEENPWIKDAELDTFIKEKKDKEKDKYLQIFKIILVYYELAIKETAIPWGNGVVQRYVNNNSVNPYRGLLYARVPGLGRQPYANQNLINLINISIQGLMVMLIKSIKKHKNFDRINTDYFGVLAYAHLDSEHYNPAKNNPDDQKDVKYMFIQASTANTTIVNGANTIIDYQVNNDIQTMGNYVISIEWEYYKNVRNNKFARRLDKVTFKPDQILDAFAGVLQMTKGGGVFRLKTDTDSILVPIESLREAVKDTTEYKRGDYKQFFKRFEDAEKKIIKKRSDVSAKQTKIDSIAKRLIKKNPKLTEKEADREALKIYEELNPKKK
jgi:hypothetical protein